MRRFWLLVLILVTPACIGAGNGSGANKVALESSKELAVAARFDETTGGLDGLVHDDSLVALGGAFAELRDGGRNATTDVLGRFSFSNVAPGRYWVLVKKDGFTHGELETEIVIGQAAYVQFSLEPTPANEPYFVVRDRRATIGCALAAKTPASFDSLQPCPILEQYNSTGWWRLSANLSAWQGGAMETEWRATQVVGSALRQRWYVICRNDRAVAEETFSDLEGKSPLASLITEAAAASFLQRFVPECAGEPAARQCILEVCYFLSTVTTYPETIGGGSPVDVGLTVFQTFSQYFSEFYGAGPPPDFSALPDQ